MHSRKPIGLRWLAVPLFGIVALFLFWYLLRLSWTVVPNADHAGSMLEAYDMLRGNWALHGWTVSGDPYWLTDLPVYAAALAFRGLDPALLHDVPAMTYLALIALVGIAAGAPFRGATPVLALAVCAALIPLVLPADLLKDVSLVGPYHTATIAAVLAALLALERVRAAPRASVRLRGALVGGAYALLTAAQAGDPFTFWIGLLPLVVVSAVDVYQRRVADPRALTPGLVALCAWASAKAIVGYVTAHQGFTVKPFDLYFAELSYLRFDTGYVVQGLLDLHGADFFGQRLDAAVAPVLVRLAGALASWYLMWRTLRAWRLGRDVEWLSVVLSLASLLLVVSFIFGKPKTDEWWARYLVPVVVFGTVVVGRWAGRQQARRPLRGVWPAIVLIGFAASYAVAPAAQLQMGPRPFPAQSLGAWLRAHNLRDGFGSYWEASIVTVATRGAVRVRPVIVDGSRLVPYHWMSAAGWYAPDVHATFVVFNVFNPARIDRRTAEATFGPPDHEYRAPGQNVVLVWDRGIRL